MQSVKVDWVLPIEREDNTPLPTSAIDRVVLELAVEGGEFVVIDEFPPDVLSTIVPDLEIGTWLFRGTVVDSKDRPSKPAVASIMVESDSPPGTLTLTLSFAE
jgi:hypothetical protein